MSTIYFDGLNSKKEYIRNISVDIIKKIISLLCSANSVEYFRLRFYPDTFSKIKFVLQNQLSDFDELNEYEEDGLSVVEIKGKNVLSHLINEVSEDSWYMLTAYKSANEYQYGQNFLEVSEFGHQMNFVDLTKEQKYMILDIINSAVHSINTEYSRSLELNKNPYFIIRF